MRAGFLARLFRPRKRPTFVRLEAGDNLSYPTEFAMAVAKVLSGNFELHGSEELDLAAVAELAEALAEEPRYQPCMALSVSDEGGAVELLLDTSLDTYSEWIPGEGADIGLIRCRATNRVVGVTLPRLRNNLCVFHDGPLRINDGFVKQP